MTNLMNNLIDSYYPLVMGVSILIAIAGAFITDLLLLKLWDSIRFQRLNKAFTKGGLVHYTCKKCGSHIWSREPIEECMKCRGEVS